MYNADTIKRMISNAVELEKDYLLKLRNGENVRVCISKGNRKIGRVMNVSLMPVMTCANCKECKFLCYDIKACNQYKNTVLPARMRNTVLAKYYRDEYFKQISDAMNRRRKNKYFRWHVAGDMMDADYFNRVIENAIAHPDFVIWTYTKNYAVVNAWVDAHGGIDAIGYRLQPNGDLTAYLKVAPNLNIMFSEWRGLEMVNPYHFPEFRVVFKDDAVKPDEKTNFYCSGNCDICKASGRGCLAGENVYCNEH